MHAMTAAHRSLPFGTRVEVTNMKNGRSVVVRIQDRGPFIRGRVLDLSYGAASAIGMVQAGTAKVRMVALTRDKAPNAVAGPPAAGQDVSRDAARPAVVADAMAGAAKPAVAEAPVAGPSVTKAGTVRHAALKPAARTARGSRVAEAAKRVKPFNDAEATVDRDTLVAAVPAKPATGPALDAHAPEERPGSIATMVRIARR